MRVGSSTWSIEPGQWAVTDHPECLTLELSGDGALQLSAALKQAGLVTHDELFFSIGQREAWGACRPAVCGDFEGIEYEYLDGNDVWRRWFLRWGQTLLFVTYNGSPQAAYLERPAIGEVLGSLRAEVGGAA